MERRNAGLRLAGDYGSLLAMRGAVGVGEAAYGAVGAALLATLFPARIRGTVIGAFLAATLVGTLLGTVLGGVLAERWGWRAAFGVAGMPGIVLAALLFPLMRIDRTARGEGGRATGWPGLRAVTAALVRTRTMVLTCVGAGFQLIVVSTVFAWLASYFVRYYGLSPGGAGVKASLVVLAAGGGTVAWSVACDALAPATHVRGFMHRRRPRWRRPRSCGRRSCRSPATSSTG